MIVSKTRNAPGWATKEDNLIPIGVKCNENLIWVSVLRLVQLVSELIPKLVVAFELETKLSHFNVHIFFTRFPVFPQLIRWRTYMKNKLNAKRTLGGYLYL